jgi:multisubunit Na+/H+ antiporter MnhC subunit
MKTKQLANILIKILGLSVVAHGIPSVISGVFNIARASKAYGSPNVYDFWAYPISSVILLAIGVYLIVKSRDVTALLFKEEDE